MNSVVDMSGSLYRNGLIKILVSFYINQLSMILTLNYLLQMGGESILELFVDLFRFFLKADS